MIPILIVVALVAAILGYFAKKFVSLLFGITVLAIDAATRHVDGYTIALILALLVGFVIGREIDHSRRSAKQLREALERTRLRMEEEKRESARLRKAEEMREIANGLRYLCIDPYRPLREGER